MLATTGKITPWLEAAELVEGPKQIDSRAPIEGHTGRQGCRKPRYHRFHSGLTPILGAVIFPLRFAHINVDRCRSCIDELRSLSLLVGPKWRRVFVLIQTRPIEVSKIFDYRFLANMVFPICAENRRSK
jgi:hypothetical protein